MQTRPIETQRSTRARVVNSGADDTRKNSSKFIDYKPKTRFIRGPAYIVSLCSLYVYPHDAERFLFSLCLRTILVVLGQRDREIAGFDRYESIEMMSRSTPAEVILVLSSSLPHALHYYASFFFSITHSLANTLYLPLLPSRIIVVIVIVIVRISLANYRYYNYSSFCIFLTHSRTLSLSLSLIFILSLFLSLSFSRSLGALLPSEFSEFFSFFPFMQHIMRLGSTS